jgi:hypothetical protein
MSIVNSDLHDREFVTPKFAVNNFFVAEKAPQVGCEKNSTRKFENIRCSNDEVTLHCKKKLCILGHDSQFTPH